MKFHSFFFVFLLCLGCHSSETKLSDPLAQLKPGESCSNGATNCGEGLYCERVIGVCEGEGSCAPKPDFCTEQYQPVCGCDGKTYGNACAAQQAGVSVRSDGECK